jgi:tetratricopeptide (TPR) repeat protein
VRARFTTLALVALGALVVGALGVAMTLATTDSAKWPVWLRPYHRWGWWAVLALLLAAALLAVWQFYHHSPALPESIAQASGSGPVGGRDVTITGGQGPTAGRDIISITSGGPSSLASALTTEVRWPTPDRTISNLPARNPVFTGRQDLLNRLYQDLATSQAAAVVQAHALHGLGGVGKTHLVLEYAHRHAGDYDLIWWVTTDQPAAIPGQLVALARRLDIPEQAEQAETIAALLNELRHHRRWLLVFDNAEQPRDLRPYWPPGGGGHVLVTSRNPAWTGLATTVAIDVLPRAEAIAFLHRRASLDEPAADALAEALGDLPLGLEQAAAYLDETGTAPAEYMGLLRDRAPELFTLGHPATSEQTIATTWTVSLDHIHAETPVAQDLLNLCAFFGPDDLPRALLTSHPDLLLDPLATALRDQLGLQQALGALRRYSLMTVSGDTVSMHRLVQAVVRHKLDTDGQRRWAETAVRLVLAAFPQEAEDVQTWPLAARLLPHVLGATDHAKALNVAPKSTANLLTKSARYLWSRADYERAKALLERALVICEVQLGPNHLETARSLHDLGNVLHYLGDVPAARNLHERALALREAQLGQNHLDTAHSLNNLGNVLHRLGDLPTARALHERALAIREVQLDPNHPHTAASLDNLAQVLRDQGDLDTARTLHERALAIREIRLGPHHPDTATSLNNLAEVLHDQDDLAAAHAMLERALSIREARLGADHPDTAHSLNSLANVLRDQGDLAGARTLHERALAIREARLGAEHPDTVRSRRDLTAVEAALREQ